MKQVRKNLFIRFSRSCMDVLSPSLCPVCGLNKLVFPDAVCCQCENGFLSGIVPPAAATRHIPIIWSCRFYENTVKKLIHQFKYQRKTRMIELFAETFPDALQADIFSCHAIELIIPVPICKNRKKERGFNQAEIIAKKLSVTFSVPVSRRNLIKSKNTPPQTKLSKRSRISNLTDSFSVKNARLVRGKTILIVDDVMTTGATLNTSAIELLKAGAKKILGFTLARTK